MSAALHLAKPEDFERLSAMVERFHAEMEFGSTPEFRERGLKPLLEGNPLGAAYLIGPAKAPVGYIVVTFGWSVEFGGMDAFVDELFIRPSVRGRGMGSEVLHKIGRALHEAGVQAMHLEVDRNDEPTQRLYARAGYKSRERYVLMSKDL